MPKGEVLHALRQRHIGNLDRQVEAVRHQAARVHPVPEALHTLLQQPIEVIAVLILGKVPLAPVASPDHVIGTAGHVHRGSWWHGGAR